MEIISLITHSNGDITFAVTFAVNLPVNQNFPPGCGAYIRVFFCIDEATRINCMARNSRFHAEESFGSNYDGCKRDVTTSNVASLSS